MPKLKKLMGQCCQPSRSEVLEFNALMPFQMCSKNSSKFQKLWGVVLDCSRNLSLSSSIWKFNTHKSYVCLCVRNGENMCVGEKDRDDWQKHCFVAAIALSHSAQKWEITWKSIEHKSHHWSEEGCRKASMSHGKLAISCPVYFSPPHLFRWCGFIHNMPRFWKSQGRAEP